MPAIRAILISILVCGTAAALVMIPYLLYRVYAVFWGYALWKANQTDG
jgi:tryptophan-rich sensory protein